jgi:NAD(P)-dependent dehydrogenase (short-subunit alcohol dehydrogenase family)
MKLATEGARIIAADKNAESARGTSHDIVSAGGEAFDATLDVTDAREVERVVDASWVQHGRVDFLVNNAGVSTVNHVWALTEDDWDLNMDVNAKGTFLVTVAMLKRMIKHDFGIERPRIVNIASGAGLGPDPLRAHYAASKHAVIGFTKSIAMELAPLGINANCVCPGLVQTPLMERELAWEGALTGTPPDVLRTRWLSTVPLGRLETPEDVAKVVAFLLSHDADYITGAAINVTGGLQTH